jgi:hypothetical protein
MPRARGRDLVAHPLADNLSFILREAEQDVQRQPAHAGGGVEALGHRNKRNFVLVEGLHQLGEVHQ